jgi:Ca2+-binding EF-hand superfamily protein
MDRDLDYMMHELDRDGDGCITFDELSYGMSKWLKEVLAQNLAKNKVKQKQAASPSKGSPTFFLLFEVSHGDASTECIAKGLIYL